MYLLMLYLPFLIFESTSSISMLGVLSVFVVNNIGIMIIPGGIGVTPIIAGVVGGFYLQSSQGELLHLDAFTSGWLSWLFYTAMLVVLGGYSFYKIQKK